MSKNKTDDFLSKFANRVEKVGRDGVMGLMKSTKLPINNMRQNYFGNQELSSSIKKNGINRINEVDKNSIDFDDRSNNNIHYFNNNTYKPSIINHMDQNMNNFSNMNNNNSSKFKLNSAKTFLPIINNNQNNRNINNNLSNNNLRNSLMYSYNSQNNENNNQNYFNSRSNLKSNSINYRYNSNNNNNINGNHFEPQLNNSINQRNIYSVANNRQNIVDYGYTPYTLKDYKKITNDVKLGKLGPNIGTEEWNQKRKRMKKMSDYGNKVMHEGKGCYVKLAESADERHKRLQEMKKLNGKWNKISEYSRGIMLNNDRNSNEQFKRNVNDKLTEEERLLHLQFELDLEKEAEEERILQQKKNAIYQQRLNKMKNLLFN